MLRRALVIAPLLAASACSPREPHDLGARPQDQVVVAEVPVLAHLAAAMDDADALTLTELLADEAPVFRDAPDPSALLEGQAIAHQALAPIEDGVDLRVLSFNAGLLDRWYPFTHVGVPEVDLRREHFADLLFADGWDVLCLQEVWEDAEVERLRVVAEDRGYRVFTGSPAHRKEHGLVIAIRSAIIDADAPESQIERQFEQEYDVEKFPGPGVERGFLSWSFGHAPSGERLRVISTHIASYAQRWRIRTFQARELGLFVAGAPTDEVVIVGGDFNAGPYYPEDLFGEVDGEPVGEWFRNAIMVPIFLHYGEVIDVFAAAGRATDVAAMDAQLDYDAAAWRSEPYGDAAGCAASNGQVLTWDWCNDLAFQQGGETEWGARLDFIFLRDRQAKARVIDASLVYTAPIQMGDRALALSDHYGVATTLRLPAP